MKNRLEFKERKFKDRSPFFRKAIKKSLVKETDLNRNIAINPFAFNALFLRHFSTANAPFLYAFSTPFLYLTVF